MKKTKIENILIIALAITLLTIVLGIAIMIFTSPEEQQPSDVTTLPSPTGIMQTGRPPIIYNEEASDKLLDYVQNRRTLSEDDRFAKANILRLIPNGEQTGIVYASSTIIIDYLQSADVFQVEIITTDIKKAKDEANVWFRTHGISQEGICQLPVEFYLEYDIANELRNSNIIFSPLGNSC